MTKNTDKWQAGGVETATLALLKAMIARPTITPREAGIMDMLARELVEIGFSVTRLRFEGDGSYPVDNLFAKRGTSGRRLLFAGHTDVVPPGDAGLWSADPFTPREAHGKLYGRGAADMKSGIAAFIAAAAAIPPEAGTLLLALSNDEEADAVNGTDKLCQWMAENGHDFDFALVGEPSSARLLGDTIRIGRRGSFSGQVRVRGTQGHVAYPEKANNPLPVLAAAASALCGQKLDAGTEHFPPSNLELTSIDTGNEASNVIPASASLRFNVRYNDLWTPDTLGDWVRARLGEVKAAARGCALDFSVSGRPSRAFLCPPGPDIDNLATSIAAITGRQPERSTGGGTSDARFIAAYGPVAECGLVGASMHQADEHIALSDLFGLAEIYRHFALRFFAGENP